MFLQLAHTQMEVFRVSKELVLEVYNVAKIFPTEERYGLTQQIKRAALSVLLNIAEGCSRKSLQERKRYFEIARGSVVELDTAFDIALNLKYLSSDDLHQVGPSISSTFKQLSALINN